MTWLLAALAAVLTWYALPRVMAYCQRQQLISYPSARCAHTQPTPRAGGLAFVVGVIPCWALGFWLLPATTVAPTFLLALVVGSVGVAVLGWLDDTRRLTQPWARLALQAVFTGAPLWWLPPVFDGLPVAIPWWFDKLFLWLGWTWFINLYNFMDGTDGLAAMQAVFMGIMISFLWPVVAWLALPLALATFVFLRHNRPPAQIFMGDIGACWLGYSLAGIMIYVCAGDISMGSPCLLISLLFAADATITFLRRLWQRQRVWEPHRQQWLHRAYDAGLSHQRIWWAGIKINLGLGLLAMIGTWGQWGWPMLVPGFMLMLYVAARIRHLELHG
mgnify:CR=1 FL=1